VNYVASEASWCVFTTGAYQRHITGNATEETKLDRYRALAINSAGKLQLRSRNDNDFAVRYPAIAWAFRFLPDETVIDGEVVALGEIGTLKLSHAWIPGLLSSATMVARFGHFFS
jgi:hypothetical protein